MTAGPTHRHDQFHRGQVPLDQMADGTATAGYAPISNGDDTATWGPAGGSGPSACDHEHTTEEFVALGDTPEIFTLAHPPMWLRNVYVQGLRVPPSLVGGSGVSVEVDTVGDDIVVVDYEVECGTLFVAFPGIEATYADLTVNQIATFETTGPAVITVEVTEGLVGDDTGIFVVDQLVFSGPSSGITLPPILGSDPFLPETFDGSSPGTFHAVAPFAGTWYVLVGGGVGYQPDLTGAVTLTVTYPTGTPTGSLAFPGTDGATWGNILATDSVAGDVAAVFFTIDSDLPADYGVGSEFIGAGTRDFYQTDVGQPFPAGTYIAISETGDTTFAIFAADFTDLSLYDGGLTGSGTYEIVALP